MWAEARGALRRQINLKESAEGEDNNNFTV